MARNCLYCGRQETRDNVTICLACGAELPGSNQIKPIEITPAKPQTKKCPYCAEDILFDAIVCKHCNRDLYSKPVQATPPPQNTLAATRAATLNSYIKAYQMDGWVLISNNNGIAQLRKIRNFNWFLFLIGLCLGLIFGLLYLVDYVVSRERIVTLALDKNGNLITNTTKYWIRTILLIIVGAIVMMFCLIAVLSQIPTN